MHLPAGGEGQKNVVGLVPPPEDSLWYLPSTFQFVLPRTGSYGLGGDCFDQFWTLKATWVQTLRRDESRMVHVVIQPVSVSIHPDLCRVDEKELINRNALCATRHVAMSWLNPASGAYLAHERKIAAVLAARHLEAETAT